MVIIYSPGVEEQSPPQKSGGSSAQSKREQKRRPKPKDGTVLFCGVCGDRALGYNFDAISCESCKAFFRRNALKTKPFTCSFEGNCKLDPHTRKFCSGCRLKKCFTVGMKKEWILNEDQLVKRRRRQQARQVPNPQGSGTDIQPCSSTSGDLMGDEGSMPYLPHEYPPSSLPHHQHLMPSSTCHSGSDSSDYMPCTPMGYYDSRSSSVTSPMKRHYSVSYGDSASPTSTTSPPAHLPHHIHDLSPSSQRSPHMGIENQVKIPKMEYTSEDEDCYYKGVNRDPMSRMAPSSHHQESVNRLAPVRQQPEPILRMPSAMSLQEPVGSSDELSNCSAIKSEVADDTEDYVIPLDHNIADLLKGLRTMYDEIFEAAYTPEQIPKFTQQPKTANQLFNMTDIFIRRLIRFAKHIPEFKSLSQTDQIHLLKGGIMEMFVLRSAMGFDSKNNGWKFKMAMCEATAPKVEGTVDSSVINNTLGSNMFMQHVGFVRQLQEVSGKDRTVLMLLFIIELMSPDRANLDEKELVSKSQERHSMWLKAYLESVHTVAEAKIIYPKLLLKLLDVRNLGEESCQMAAHLDITNLEPLLVEVFDLSR